MNNFLILNLSVFMCCVGDIYVKSFCVFSAFQINTDKLIELFGNVVRYLKWV